MALSDWVDGAAGGTPLSAARLNERDAAIIAAQEAADGAAPAVHTHAAADIASGTLPAARIPSLEISKITGLQAALSAIEGRLDVLEGE